VESNNLKNSIILPIDFTEKCEYALKHAIFYSNFLNTKIVGIHIIKKDKYYEEAKRQLDSWKSTMENKYNIKIECFIRNGKLFKEIKNFCKEIDGLLVVMGLHNPKRALKTLIGSKKPFILIQDDLKSEKLNEIVIPFDENEDARVQLNWAIFFHQKFNSNINIIKPFISSDSKNEKMRKNIYFIRNVLDSKNIVYGIRTAKRGSTFNEAIYDFAKEINADLIFIMSYNFKKFILKSEKFNVKIPVMCVNPADTKFLPGKFV